MYTEKEKKNEILPCSWNSLISIDPLAHQNLQNHQQHHRAPDPTQHKATHGSHLNPPPQYQIAQTQLRSHPNPSILPRRNPNSDQHCNRHHTEPFQAKQPAPRTEFYRERHQQIGITWGKNTRDRESDAGMYENRRKMRSLGRRKRGEARPPDIAKVDEWEMGCCQTDKWVCPVKAHLTD